VDYEPPPPIGGLTSCVKKPWASQLSPDLQPNTPPCFPVEEDCTTKVLSIGRFLLYDQLGLESNGLIATYKALHCDTQQECICKVIPIDKYRSILSAYWRVGHHDCVTQVMEVILGDSQAYAFFPRHYGDLHSYVRNKRKLKESEAIVLFTQIVEAVAHCHDNGIVLRDLKLRKFVFKDESQTTLMLEGLEDAYVLEDEDDDSLADKHGCPAYVSPEILNTNQSYSGRAADVWSLGVMLYTLIVGRYPFHDVEPSALFSKIRRGQYTIPDSVSSRAKCLIRNLLRLDPSERLSAEQVLQHPWLCQFSGFTLISSSSSSVSSSSSSSSSLTSSSHKQGAKPSADSKSCDQVVPSVVVQEPEDFFS